MTSSALVTFAIGDKYRELGAVSHRSFKRYAERYSHDLLIVAEHSRGCAPVFEKMICGDLLDRYERLLILDTDIVIAPDCPDLLRLVPEDRFGAYLVSRHTELHDAAVLLIQQHLHDLGWQRDYFNAGLMVASRLHRPMFDPEDPDFAVWTKVCSEVSHKVTFAEQTYLNYKLQQLAFPLFDIGYEFNHTLAPRNAETRFGSHIVHCKGHRRGTRLKELKRTSFVLERPRLRRLLTRWPSLTRAFDALP